MFNRFSANITDDGSFAFSDFDIKFKDLNIFCGANGCGKTFMFKLTWFNAYMMQIYKVLLMMRAEDLDKEFARQINMWFPLTFVDYTKLTGWVSLSKKAEGSEDPENDYSIHLDIDQGQLKSFYVNVGRKDKFAQTELKGVQFNSKDARTFNNYQSYINISKKISSREKGDIFFQEMGEFFRLYDIVWFENVRVKIEHFRKNGVPAELKDNVAIYFENESNLKSIIDFNFDNDIPIVKTGSGQEIPFNRLSSGLQSILMMMMFV